MALFKQGVSESFALFPDGTNIMGFRSNMSVGLLKHEQHREYTGSLLAVFSIFKVQKFIYEFVEGTFKELGASCIW